MIPPGSLVFVTFSASEPHFRLIRQKKSSRDFRVQVGRAKQAVHAPDERMGGIL
jgi:hypothetical protein